jgi:hypothetical protein
MSGWWDSDGNDGLRLRRMLMIATMIITRGMMYDLGRSWNGILVAL